MATAEPNPPGAPSGSAAAPGGSSGSSSVPGAGWIDADASSVVKGVAGDGKRSDGTVREINKTREFPVKIILMLCIFFKKKLFSSLFSFPVASV